MDIECPVCGGGNFDIKENKKKGSSRYKCNNCLNEFDVEIINGYVADDTRERFFALANAIVGAIARNFKLKNVFLAFSVENPDKHVKGEQIVFCTVRKGNYNRRFMKGYIEEAIKTMGDP